MKNTISSFPRRRESSHHTASRSETMLDFASLREDRSINWIPARAGMTARKFQHGFSIITAIFLLVVLAFLGVAMVSFSTSQHQSSAMDVMGSRAYQAARAGIEWQAYYVVSSPVNASAPVQQCGTNNLDPLGGTLSPFAVTVNCLPASYSEGVDASGVPITIWIYDVSAVACTDTVCPSLNPGQSYVERRITVKMGKLKN